MLNLTKELGLKSVSFVMICIGIEQKYHSNNWQKFSTDGGVFK